MVGRSQNRLDFHTQDAFKTNIPLAEHRKICALSVPEYPIQTLNALQVTIFLRESPPSNYIELISKNCKSRLESQE